MKRARSVPLVVAALLVALPLASSARAGGSGKPGSPDAPAPATPTAQPMDGGKALRYVRSIGDSLPEGLIVKELAEPHLLSEKDLVKLRRMSFPGKPAIAASCVDAASIAVSAYKDPDMPVAVIVAMRFGDEGQAAAGAEALQTSTDQDHTDTFHAGPLVVVVTTTDLITSAGAAKISHLARDLLASAKKEWDAGEKDSIGRVGK